MEVQLYFGSMTGIRMLSASLQVQTRGVFDSGRTPSNVNNHRLY